MAKRKSRGRKTSRNELNKILEEIEKIEKEMLKEPSNRKKALAVLEMERRQALGKLTKLGITPEELYITTPAGPVKRSIKSLALDVVYRSPFIIPRSAVAIMPGDDQNTIKLKNEINNLIRLTWEMGNRTKSIIAGLDVIPDSQFEELIEKAVKYIGTGNGPFNTYSKGIPKRDKAFGKRYRQAILKFLRASDKLVHPFHKKLVGLWMYLKLRPAPKQIRKELMTILEEIDKKITEFAKATKKRRKKKSQ